MSAVYIFEEMRFPIELLAASLIFFLPFAERKDHFTVKAVTCFFGGALLSLLFFVIFGDKDAPRFVMLQAFWYIFIALMPIIFAKICFVISLCDAVFFTIFAFAAQDLVYVTVHEFIARAVFPSLRNHLLLYILIAAAACLLFYTIIYHLLKKPLITADRHLFEDTPRNLAFYFVLFALTIFNAFYYQAQFARGVSFMLLGPWFMEFSFCIFILVIQYSLLRSKSLAAQNALLEQSLRSSEKYYEMSRESIAIINRKCHDFKHQLKALSMAGEEERQAYIEEAQKNILFYQNLVHSDNQVINTILAEKGLFCEEKGIHLSCSVNDVPLDFIHVTDLYAMLGNAIDNAIEYVSRLDSEDMRVISFSITKMANFISIQVNNPYLGPEITSGSLPFTTKKDAANHGFGLRSIQYVAEKYNGQMEISTADRMFTLQIIIPIAAPAPSL